MMSRSSSLFALVLAAVFAGCAEISTVEERRESASDGAVARESYAAPRAMARNAAALMMAKAPGRANSFAAVEGRQVAFTASLRISSPDVAAALRQATEIARKLGGYASSVNDRGATLKIPVKNAETALAGLEKLGKVDSRNIQAQDVTDTAFDMDMRIKNLEKLHARLTELVEKAKDVKDILAVEKELSRVTGELERLKAQRQNLQKMVDFVTFNLYFTTSAAQEVRTNRMILPRIAALGLRSTFTLANSQPEDDDAPFDFTLPSGFIPVVMRNRDDFFAVDDQDTILSAVKWDEIPGADLAYYEAAISRALRELHGYEVTSEVRTAANGDKYIVFKGERKQGGTAMRYEASCRIAKRLFGADEVLVIEVLGTADRMAKLELKPLHESVK